MIARAGAVRTTTLLLGAAAVAWAITAERMRGMKRGQAPTSVG